MIQSIDDLLAAVCSIAGRQAEARAAAAGASPADIRRAGLNAEAFERYTHHYGQAPDRAMRDTLERRLAYLRSLDTPGK